MNHGQIKYLLFQAHQFATRGLHDEAHRCLASIANNSAAPGNLPLIIGMNLIAARRFQQALSYLWDYAAADSGSFEAKKQLAIALRHTGNTPEAERLLLELVKACPDDNDLQRSIAEIKADMGRFDEAEHILRKMLQDDPRDVSSFELLCQIRKMTEEDRELAQGMEKNLNGALSVGHQIAMLFALGKFYDDLRRYEKAFSYYAEANRLKRVHAPPYDHALTVKIVDMILNSHPPEILERKLSYASVSAKPVLVVGMPRSGTTLVERMLTESMSVYGAGELQYWPDILNEYKRHIFTGDYNQTVVEEMAQRYLEAIDILAPNAERVVDKMPGNFRFLGPIHIVFPCARFVHVKRDPVDTCLSIFFQNLSHNHAYACDFDDLSRYYREYRRITDHWQDCLPPEILLSVTYEELVKQPEEIKQVMMRHLGLALSNSCAATPALTQTILTASRWQARQPIYKSSAQRWKNYEPWIGPLLELLR